LKATRKNIEKLLILYSNISSNLPIKTSKNIIRKANKMTNFIIIPGFILSFILGFFIILLIKQGIKQGMLMILEENEKEGE
jgi:cell division protein FtsX